MPETFHLVRRGTSWYYRRRVPKHLVGTFGKDIVQVSLGTTSLKQAQRARPFRDIEWDKKFGAAEKSLAQAVDNGQKASNSGPKVLTEAEAVKRIRTYVETSDERCRGEALTAEPLRPDERREWEIELEIDLAIAKGTASQYDHDEFISRQWERIFPRTEILLDEENFSPAAVAELVKRAEIELAKRALTRARDDYRHSYFDHLFDPKVPPAVTVRDLAKQFLTLKSEEAQAHNVAQKTLDKQQANVVLVREILGDETLVRDINWDACRSFCSVLAQVPPNRTKIYPGQPLNEAIERAKQEGREALSAITQQQYLATLKELLAPAVKKGLFRVNYAEDLRPLRLDDLAPDEKTIPFEIDQLKNFFQSDFYRKCAEEGNIPYRQADKDWTYWFPLISLFTGMRPKEVFQLHVDDLKTTDQGTPYLHVVATNEDDDTNAPEHRKTIKTLTSKRKIPLHPELVRLGFLAFVADQRHASHDPLLFRSLTRNKYGDPAAYVLRRFREAYLKPMDLKPRQAAYSFRHTWRDAARRIKASPDFLKAIGGWSDSKTTADVYGSKDQPDLYAKDMASIGYEGLDLSHLYPKPPSA